MKNGSGIAYVAGLPFLGVLPSIRRNPLEFFSSLLRRHSDRVQFRVLGRRVILLCHPEDLEQVLVRDREMYGRSAELLALRLLFGDGLLASEGALWRRQRSMIQPSFQHSATLRYAHLMLQTIGQQSAHWRAGEILDIHAAMMQYTRETICAVLFGDAATAGHRRIGEAVSIVFGDLRTEILYLPLWRRIPLPRNRRWNRATKLLNRSITQFIAEKRASVNVSDDLLSALLQARDADGGVMSDQQVHDEILTFFLAGHETAALALTWAAYLLANHQDVQRKVSEEVAVVTANSDVKPEHYPHFKYLSAVVKETLRLYPPVWSLGRKALTATELGGQKISRGTALWLCIHQLHRDARWFPEPDRFRPERWLEENSARPFTYLPFGIGPRVCIGQHFAMTETVLGLAAILQRFRLSTASSSPVAINPWITLRPKNRIQLVLQAPASCVRQSF